MIDEDEERPPKMFLKRRDTVGLETFLEHLGEAALSAEDMHKHAWAGGVSGIVADSLMHPFDTISTRLKVQGAQIGGNAKYSGLWNTTRVMVREEGIRSLFKGVTATVYCAVPSSALYFGAYEWVKHVGIHVSEKSGAHTEYHADMVHLMAGISAELAASVIVVPFEVIKSRLQIGGKGGALSGLWRIFQREGMAGLFSGYRACILLDCTHSGLQFLFYERLKRLMKNDNASTFVEGTAQDIAIGALSGGIAAFISNPMDVIAVRLMTQDALLNNRIYYKGTFDCLRSIAVNEGVRGLWSGSAARILSIAPLSALTFAVYEKMKWGLMTK